MAKQQLTHFGIHEDSDGVRHLFQDLCPDGFNYVDVKGSNGMSARKIKEVCSHAIIPTLALRNLPDKHWNQFQKIFDDGLVSLMLPYPTDGWYISPTYVEEESLEGLALEYFSCLERLSTPLIKGIQPLWAISLPELKKLLSLTNVHPLVLTGAKVSDSEKVLKFLELSQSYPRRLIISGTKDLILPKTSTRLASTLSNTVDLATLISLPLEHIGGELIKRYCRRQSFTHKMTR